MMNTALLAKGAGISLRSASESCMGGAPLFVVRRRASTVPAPAFDGGQLAIAVTKSRRPPEATN